MKNVENRKSVAVQEILKKGRAKENVSAASSFIANTHNELCELFIRKNEAYLQFWANGGSGPPTAPPVEFATVANYSTITFRFSLI